MTSNLQVICARIVPHGARWAVDFRGPGLFIRPSFCRRVLHLLDQRTVDSQNFLAAVIQHLAFAGQPDKFYFPLIPVQQGAFEGTLQRADLLADRRLRDPVNDGASAEAPCVNQITKYFKASNLHDSLWLAALDLNIRFPAASPAVVTPAHDLPILDLPLVPAHKPFHMLGAIQHH